MLLPRGTSLEHTIYMNMHRYIIINKNQYKYKHMYTTEIHKHTLSVFFTMACTYVVGIVSPPDVSALEINYMMLLKLNASLGNNWKFI